MLTTASPSTWGWGDWSRFRGSDLTLKYARRDLPTLDRIVAEFVPGRTACVQAGGNVGLFPKRLAESFATVYTFEPDPECFAALCVNAPEPNIVKIQAAVGAGRGLIALSRERPPHKPIGPTHEGLGHVVGPGVLPQVRIDDVLFLPVCDLLYLDIEGYELPAIQGAYWLIDRCHPVIVVEITQNAERFGFAQEAVRHEIRRHGYRFAAKFSNDEVFVRD